MGFLRKLLAGLLTSLVFLFMLNTSPSAAQSGDPFSNLTSSQRSCVETALGSTRYNELRNGAQFTDADANAVNSSGCFNSEQTITTAGTPTTIEPVKVDPFGSMPDSILNCVRDALTVARFEALRAGAAFTPDDQSKIETANCFQQTVVTGEVTIQSEGGGTHELSSSVKTCLQKEVGEAAFNDISTGKRQPTSAEQDAGRRCFEQGGFKPKEYKAGEGITATMEKCMRLALGDDFNKLKSGQTAFTEEHRKKAYKCMGHTGDGFEPPPAVTISATVESCLQKAVGEARFQAISTGGTPTESERAKGEACFSETKKISSLAADAIAPTDPKKVPFLKQSTKIRITKIAAQGTTRAVIEGEGPQDAVVDVYTFSDPKQSSVTADKNGKWSLTYDGDPGEHTVYAVAKDAGENIRSAASDLVVGQAQAQDEDAATATQRIPAIYYILAVLLIFIPVGYIVYLVRRHRGPTLPPAKS